MASDLEHRVLLLEKALGFDLDTTSKCSGDPSHCEADPCTADRCPVRQNALRRTQRTVVSMARDLAMIINLIQGMIERGEIPERLLQAAKLRVERDQIVYQIQEMESLSLEPDAGILFGSVWGRIDAMKSDLGRLNEEIARLESSHDESPDPG